MESIITSFKKRQRQIIDTFVAGYSSFPGHLVVINVIDSEVKDEIKFLFQDVTGVAIHVEKINLNEYRLNDIRQSAITERLRQIVFHAEENFKHKMADKVLEPKDEQVIYKPFFQTQLNSVDRPYCIGLRANDEEDSIMEVYGEDPHSTIVEFFDKLLVSDFIITMKDGK